MGEVVCEKSTKTEPEESFREQVERIEKSITSNHANTLAFLECLRVCREEIPYREAEAQASTQLAFTLSTQTPHTLMGFLVAQGGIVKKQDEVGESASPEVQKSTPSNYLLKTTDAGLEVLEKFDPFRRIAGLLDGESLEYRDLYLKILSLCEYKVTLAFIDETLCNEQALFAPKRIYPEYFISKLETVGGLEWEEGWKTTEEGKTFLQNSIPR